jgi:chemotaxis protein methyltransferase CheR
MEVAEIARALGDVDAEQRRRAVVAMGEGYDPALGPLLLRALADRDWRVREEAIRVGRSSAERLGIIPELIASLTKTDDIGLRNAALALLKRLGGSALPALLAALPSAAPAAQKLVVEVLGHGGDADVMRSLADAANSEDLNLATTAIEALGAMGGADAEAVLRRKLAARSPHERIAALDALDRLGAVVPFAELAPLLDDRLTLRYAVRVLGRSGAAEAVPALLAALLDRSSTVAGAAAVALFRLSDDAPLRAVVRERIVAAGGVVRERLRALASERDAAGTAATHLLEQSAPAATACGPLAENGTAPATPGGAEPLPAAWGRGARLEPEAFRAIAGLIRVHSGIRLTDDVRPMVERRLHERLAVLGLTNFDEYERALRADGPGDGEIERAVEAIATNETYFFRDLPQLRSFEQEVLPELHALAATRRRLSVWSAGCSTGEEAYTLAILLARSPRFAGWNLRVFGNDIARRVVQTARKAVYRGSSFRAMPPEYASHFVQGDDGTSAVNPEIRALCHFARFNLLDAASAAMFGRVDAIFCRNVLIYFDDEARRRVVASFYERLNPGGYLMLGHSDSLLNITTEFELAQLSGDLAYRKPLTADRRSR